MQTFFQFLMLSIFGKKWVWFDLKQGYKHTLFMNEVETAMLKDKQNSLINAKTELENELAGIEAEDVSDEKVLSLMPEEDRENKKAFYDFQKEYRGARIERINEFKNRIKSLESDISAQEGEIGKAYSITYQNRIKYDFIKTYKIKKSYADKK